ncbi:MAG: hypothetical protein A3I05_09960 [Deltaproteobacteria bacterium RIFCSPLOWO2_02_FULL_44_10]|nr:MAG: hypothetical protein A3C46_09225 [Deltaproteobacteria bacterium RIFCSPHIGHO2_02_FULL_44_16]OGQ45015.1 MAG: hypothetical protein A3I05_09960 [Deltaproteobacteria bacterium RIFCSPLOWO2_02_FULL_44_10]
MVRKEIEMLVEKWTSDAGFRTKMRKDPMATLTSTGVKLTPEEMNAFKNIDWKLSDQELQSRVSKWLA